MIPAPLARRLAAAFYDLFLLVGVLMCVLFLDVVVRDAFDIARNYAAIQALAFLSAFVFFAWFWTHGGQTLGLRSWKLRLVERDGAPVRWPTAALRFAVTCATLGLGFVSCPFDARSRALQDIVSGTELVKI